MLEDLKGKEYTVNGTVNVQKADFYSCNMACRVFNNQTDSLCSWN